MTFLLHYYRIMAVSNMRLVYLGVIIIVALWGASQAMMVSLQCIPLQAVWYTNGVINIVSDFNIMILPLPIVWKLNLPPSQKFLLSGIFGLGFLWVLHLMFYLRFVDTLFPVQLAFRYYDCNISPLNQTKHGGTLQQPHGPSQNSCLPSLALVFQLSSLCL